MMHLATYDALTTCYTVIRQPVCSWWLLQPSWI